MKTLDDQDFFLSLLSGDQGLPGEGVSAGDSLRPGLVRPHPAGGEQRLYRFGNGYGASVVWNGFSYGGEEGLLELAVVRFSGEGLESYSLDYSTPITEDVIGHLDEEAAQDLLRQIRDLDSVAVSEVN